MFRDAPIQFTQKSTSWNESAGSGCILENAFLNSSSIFYPTVLIDGASPKINNCTVVSGYWSIIISGGAPTISNNTLNSLTGDGGGLSCTGINSTINITENIISDCETGVLLIGNTTILTRNLIIGNNVGLQLYEAGACLVVNNTISQNAVGVFLNASPVSVCNNIEDNYEYNLRIGDRDVNFTSNWWGTTDSQAINQSICDFKNNSALGIANVVPFLTSPNYQALTFSNASAGLGGSISPEGVTKLNYGDNQTFTMIPNGGYHVADVLVNGSSVGTVNSYTLENVTGRVTIYATFELDPTPTTTANPTTNPTQQPTTPPNNSPTQSPTSPPADTVPELSLFILLPMFALILFSVIVVKLRTLKKPS
jgi:hypothetical protein